jgi:hypothetical protein
MWLCKRKKKKREKSIEKMDKCPNYQNNGYLDVRLKKEKKDSPCCPTKLFPSSKNERYVLRSKVELG